MITPPKEWERYTSTFQVDIGSGQPEPAPPRVTIQSQPHTLHARMWRRLGCSYRKLNSVYHSPTGFLFRLR